MTISMRLPWLLLLFLASCACRPLDDTIEDPLSGAIELLESLGVKNLNLLCHDDSNVLPSCPHLQSRKRYSERDKQQQDNKIRLQGNQQEHSELQRENTKQRLRFERYRYRQKANPHQQQEQANVGQIRRNHRYLEEEYQEEEPVTRIVWFDFWNTLGAVACVCVSSIAAGLTVSLLSLDPLVLLIKMRASGDEQEKKQAARLVTIVKRRNLLLVSLILLSTISSEALPIFLQDLMPRYVAILVAVILVIVFGEVLPTILFTGPNQLQIASNWAPVVKCIMCLLYPVAAPIARVLDHVHHDNDAGNMYNRGELAALIRIQYEERMAFHERKKKNINHKDSPSLASTLKGEFNRTYPEGLPSIASDEINLVEGALQMKMKVAMDVYCPLDKVFAIPFDTVLDEANVVRIFGSAYSRIPVYERRGNENDKRAIRGVLMARQLIMVKPEKEPPLSGLRMYTPFCVSPKMNLVDLVGLFQTGTKDGKGGHLALVCARPDIANAALDRNEPVPDEAIVMG